jgi:hypothetical protein
VANQPCKGHYLTFAGVYMSSSSATTKRSLKHLLTQSIREKTNTLVVTEQREIAIAGKMLI